MKGKHGTAEKFQVEINGPAQPSVTKTEDDDGYVKCSYTPSLPGEYTVSIKLDGKPIKGSPYTAEVIGESDPKLERISKVSVTGKGILIGKTFAFNDFWIDGRSANISAGLAVHIKNPERASSQLKIHDMGDGTFKCTYKPTAAGLYIINVKVEGIHVPGSPFYVQIR